jgi:hypothetical protein
MGFGADLLLVDETCDISYEVYRSRITRMLGDNPGSVYIEIGNPWHRDNHFFSHWIDPSYKKVHIGWEQALAEGRVTQDFIEEQKSQLTGREFQVLYDANFPDSSEDQLIDWAWINGSIGKIFAPPDEILPIPEVVPKSATTTSNPLVKKVVDMEIPEVPLKVMRIGVDVAERGNDLTVVTVAEKDTRLNNYTVKAIYSWGKCDLMPTVGKIMPILQKWQTPHTLVNVDANGVGSGVYSRLDELRREKKLTCEIRAFKGGMSCTNDEKKQRFLNLKAESYWHLRKIFEDGKISIPENKDLISQLNKMKWELTSSEKIRIRDPGTKTGDTAEEKSPDYADSLNLCVFPGASAPFAMRFLDLKKTI